MKKTTTRLATIAAVLVMSTFAIVLAQHDARKRDRTDDSVPMASLAGQPAEPLNIDSAWPGENAIIRGNNDRFLSTPRENADYANYLRDEPGSLPNSLPAFPEESGSYPPAIPTSLDSVGFDSPGLDLVDQSNISESYPAQWPQHDSVSYGAADIHGTADYDSASYNSDVVLAQEVQSLPAWASDSGRMPALPGAPSPTAPPPLATLSSPQPAGNQPALPQHLSSSQPPQPLAGQPAFDQSGNYGLPSSAAPAPNYPVQNYPPPTSSPLDAGTSYATSDSTGAGNFGGHGAAGPRTELVSNQPGSRYLDGSQNPIMQIQKRAPEEIQVGKKATFVITVRNAGNATAHDVTVIDRIPRGARFSESSPAITPTADGVLTWNLGEMGAGDERTINLQIIPEVEGEVGSVASVHFAAQASVRTIATLPQLMLEIESVGPVIIGQPQQIVVTVQNTGSGVARGVRLEADIPAQLRHESGETQLEAMVGDLRPNESRRMTLNTAAVQPGQSQCVLRAVNDDGVQTEKVVAVDVRTPQLAATISGPSLRYLERQASYQIVVTNTGTAIARNLDFVVHLPVGLKFVSVDIPQASYNPQTHSISLGLAELDSGQSAPFTVSVLPVQLGPQGIRFNATGDLNISAEAKAQVTVAGLVELVFTIDQDNGTVEVGATTTYAVQVTNVGNQSDKNVQLVVQLPEGANLLQVDAPVDYRVEAGRIVFAPVAEMRNRDTKKFRFQIQHNRAGNQVIRSQLTSENWPVAVVKEEGTLVYNDQN